MRIVGSNIAVLDRELDGMLSCWVADAKLLAHDPGIFKHYTPHIQPGRVVVDAGAAIGDHTTAYAHCAGDPSLVHAFEPNPYMVECLRHNCPGVNIYPFALSDGEGELLLGHDQENAGASMATKHLQSSKPLSFIVNSVKLDDFSLDNVCFIKWDIEGHEVYGLRGAEETIRRNRPIMIVEWNEPMLTKQGSTTEELFNTLDSFAYRCELFMGSVDERRGEYLCKPK